MDRPNDYPVSEAIEYPRGNYNITIPQHHVHIGIIITIVVKRQHKFQGENGCSIRDVFVNPSYSKSDSSI